MTVTKIFESRDMSIGWDGKFNGEECPEGVYFCVVTFNDSSGKNLKLSSGITLIR